MSWEVSAHPNLFELLFITGKLAFGGVSYTYLFEISTVTEYNADLGILMIGDVII